MAASGCDADRENREGDIAMAYEWSGIQKVSFEEVVRLHNANELCGYLKLYDDNTECYLDENYEWEEIVKHHENGGEFGFEIC